MKTSTNKSVPVLAVARAEQEVLQALRTAHSDLPETGTNVYARNLAGDVLSRPVPRGFSVRGMLTLLHDAFERGASEAQLQAVPDALSVALKSWYGHTGTLNLRKEWGEETAAEGEKNCVEIMFDDDPSHVNLFNLENAHRKVICESEDYLRAARMRVSSPLNVA